MATFHFGPSRAGPSSTCWAGEDIYPQCVKVLCLTEQTGMVHYKIFANAIGPMVQDDLWGSS